MTACTQPVRQRGRDLRARLQEGGFSNPPPQRSGISAPTALTGTDCCHWSHSRVFGSYGRWRVGKPALLWPPVFLGRNAHLPIPPSKGDQGGRSSPRSPVSGLQPQDPLESAKTKGVHPVHQAQLPNPTPQTPHPRQAITPYIVTGETRFKTHNPQSAIRNRTPPLEPSKQKQGAPPKTTRAFGPNPSARFQPKHIYIIWLQFNAQSEIHDRKTPSPTLPVDGEGARPPSL